MSEKYYTKNGGGVVIAPPCEGCPKTYKYDYKYNGKELQGELGLNLYDMPFRDYDPAIGRWTGIDPVTNFDTTPYNGFDNNPVFWADPSGASTEQATDYLGRDKFDRFGIYISPMDRGPERNYNFFDVMDGGNGYGGGHGGGGDDGTAFGQSAMGALGTGITWGIKILMAHFRTKVI